MSTFLTFLHYRQNQSRNLFARMLNCNFIPFSVYWAFQMSHLAYRICLLKSVWQVMHHGYASNECVCSTKTVNCKSKTWESVCVVMSQLNFTDTSTYKVLYLNLIMIFIQFLIKLKGMEFLLYLNFWGDFWREISKICQIYINMF